MNFLAKLRGNIDCRGGRTFEGDIGGEASETFGDTMGHGCDKRIGCIVPIKIYTEILIALQVNF